MASKVYFTDFCTGTSETLPQKLSRLILSAGIDQIDFKDKYVAIKIHFGELGNMAHLRAGYARVLVNIIKDLGGKPFLTDCNTMYVGSRKNALDHLETAYLNGFTPYSTGCHILIADGLKGTDDVAVPVEGGEYVKFAKIGRAVMDADIVISLNHFKGHEEAGFGGAIKNLGMGCGSNEGKRDMHSAGRPLVDPEKCVGCGTCAKYCAHEGPQPDGKVMKINWVNCMGCGRCVDVCPMELKPLKFYKYAALGDAEKLLAENIMDCFSCKCCEYICSSKIPLVSKINAAKGLVAPLLKKK